MISAVAITYNEEAFIESFIKSLSFATEIIIIDSHSTDNTITIAKSLGAKVLVKDFVDFSSQKNFAIQQASNDWVVFFDPDELVLPGLAKEIEQKISSKNTEIKAYKVKRNFFFMGKKIKFSGFKNDVVIRVFNKNYCEYNGNLVHETLKVNGEIGLLKHKCDHHSYKTFDRYNKKLTKYSKLQAKMLYEKNIRPNFFHFFIRPWYRFFHQYIIQLGIFDGKEGFILAYLSAFAVFKRYLYLWTMYRKID